MVELLQLEIRAAIEHVENKGTRDEVGIQVWVEDELDDTMGAPLSLGCMTASESDS